MTEVGAPAGYEPPAKPGSRTTLQNAHLRAWYRPELFRDRLMFLFALDMALFLEPRSDEAHFRRGCLLHDLRRHEEALASFEQSIAWAPEAVGRWLNKASEEALLGRSADELRSLLEFQILAGPIAFGRDMKTERRVEELETQGIRPAPRGALGWLAEGARRVAEGRFDEAISALDRVLTRERTLTNAWLLKGNILTRMKRFGDAMACFEEGLRHDPGDLRFWESKVDVLRAMSRHEETLEAYDAILRLAPRHASIWSARGALLEKMRRRTEANASRDVASQLRREGEDEERRRRRELSDPQVRWGNLRRSLLEEALAAHEQGRCREAVTYFGAAIAMNPDDPEGWCGRASCLEHVGRFDEALEIYERALELEPQAPLTRFRKAQLEDRLGRGAAAADSYQQFLALAPATLLEKRDEAQKRLEQLGPSAKP